MFERVLFQVSDAENTADITFLSFSFGLLSILLVDSAVPFQVEGTNFAGVMAVLVMSLAMAYPFVRHMIDEEQEEAAQHWSEKQLLRRHAGDLKLYLGFFLGATLAFAVSTFFVGDGFYGVQHSVLESLGAPTGNVHQAGAETSGVTGNLFSDPFLMQIIQNNLWVFFVTFVLTFFVTSGVIFVLAWNASVLGVLIGSLSDSVYHVPFWTIPYLPHGLPEIGGYVLAGVAGTLLSYDVEQLVFGGNDGESRIDWVLLKDAATLLIVGVGFILVAGVIEVL